MELDALKRDPDLSNMGVSAKGDDRLHGVKRTAGTVVELLRADVKCWLTSALSTELPDIAYQRSCRLFSTNVLVANPVGTGDKF